MAAIGRVCFEFDKVGSIMVKMTRPTFWIGDRGNVLSEYVDLKDHYSRSPSFLAKNEVGVN